MVLIMIISFWGWEVMMSSETLHSPTDSLVSDLMLSTVRLTCRMDSCHDDNQTINSVCVRAGGRDTRHSSSGHTRLSPLLSLTYCWLNWNQILAGIQQDVIEPLIVWMIISHFFLPKIATKGNSNIGSQSSTGSKPPHSAERGCQISFINWTPPGSTSVQGL